MRSETEIAYRTRWDKKDYLLQSSQILRDIQLALNVENPESVRLLSLNRSDASLVKALPAKTNLEIITIDDLWARVKEKSSGMEGWVSLQALRPRYDDLGVYVNIIDTYLRKDPHSASRVITTVPPLASCDSS